MTAETRAGWLWKVAFNTARRAAATELKAVSLMVDPVDRLFKSNYDQDVLETLRRAIDSLPVQSKCKPSNFMACKNYLQKRLA